MIKEQKLNNIKITPLNTIFDNKKYKHYDLFNKPFPLIFICSRRGWGKTSLIYNILKHCAIKKKNLSTQIHYFSCTAMNDNVFIEMNKKFKKYNFDFFIHDDILNEDGENILEKLYLESKYVVEENYEKFKRMKYQYPLYIFIFDDFSRYMKSPLISQICKQSRHTRTMLIFSSQYLHD